MTRTVGLRFRDQTQVDLDVCVRFDTLVPSWQDAVIERVEALDRAGRIGEFRIRMWPRETRLSPYGIESEVAEAVDRFEEWASRTETSLRPAFSVRTRDSKLTGDREEILVAPEVCIAAYEGGSLVGVVPHTDAGEVYTVEEFLSELERPDRERPSRSVADHGGSMEAIVGDE